jgi:hypothetical protein
MLMGSALFWDITQRRMAKDYHSTLRNTPESVAILTLFLVGHIIKSSPFLVKYL